MARSRYAGRRYHLLDVIRGLTLISMILYHASWDLVYLFGVNWPWYRTASAQYWQQSICWTFIILSGFCVPLSRHKWKRGLIVFGAGLLVTAVTLVFMPEDKVICGVLTFIGSAMLITALLQRPILSKIPALLGIVLNGYLFYFFYPVNQRLVTLYPGVQHLVPGTLYKDLFTTWLGFPEPGFWSTDYFSILPWIFLYFVGYFLYRLLPLDRRPLSSPLRINIPPLSWLGRNSLLIYMLHQPVIYMVLTLLHMAKVL